MLRTLSIGYVAAASLFGAEASLSWTRAGTTQTCAGIQIPCNSMATCTRVGVGPCNDTAVGPPFYITSEYVGMAFIGSDTLYQTTSSEVKVVNPFQNDNNGYRDYNDTNQYAYTMTGAYFGSNPNSSGGYIGVASFLMKNGRVSTNKNGFYYSSVPGRARVDRSSSGGSQYGAPDGPQEVCIAPKNGNACGSNITYTAGDYKFTIYGYTVGENYSTDTRPGSNGFPSPTNYIGIRMKLTAVNLNNLTASFNANGVSLDNLGTADVTSMSLGSTRGKVSWAFPTKYNVGTDPNVPAYTRDVKIKASAVAGSSTSLYLDYLFKSSDFTTKDVYFVYDPTTTADSTPMPVAGAGTVAPNNTTTTPVGTTSATVSVADCSLISIIAALVSFIAIQ